MKKLLLSILFVIALSTGSYAVVDGQEATDTSTPAPRTNVLTNNIDGIDVPLDVLEYAQFEYPGHAVTKVDKIRHAGQEVYRLRVDRDDLLNDYSSIILLYDLNWKLVGQDKLTAPPPRQKPTPKPAPIPVQATDDDKPDDRPANESESDNVKPDREDPSDEDEGEDDEDEGQPRDEGGED